MAGSGNHVRAWGIAAHGAFHARGFHPTSVCGTFGAAVAAGRLLGLDAERIATAMGIAGSFAFPGSSSAWADGSPDEAACTRDAAAQAGVQGRAAQRGGGPKGPASVLEGRYGLYAVASRQAGGHRGAARRPRRAVGDGRGIAFKAYPACHFMHLAGRRQLVRRAAASADGAEISAVTVRVPRERGAGGARTRGRQARAPHAVRRALQPSVWRGRAPGARWSGRRRLRAEAIRDPDVLALAGRVGYTTWADGTEPSPFGGEAVLTLADGRRLEASVPFPAGSRRTR